MSASETHAEPDGWRIATNLLGQDRVLVQHRSVVRAFGDRDVAAFFEQLVYWSSRTKDPNRWVHKTYAEWFDELLIPERTLRRIVNRLKTDQLIETEVHKVQGAPTVHYRVTDAGVAFLCAALSTPDVPDGTGQNDRNRTGQNGRIEPDKMAGTSYTKPTGIECVKAARPSSKIIQQETPIHTHAETLQAQTLIQALQDLTREPATPRFNTCLFFLQGQSATPETIAAFGAWFHKVHLKGGGAGDPPTSAQVHQLWLRFTDWQAKQRKPARRTWSGDVTGQVDEIRHRKATETEEEREARIARNQAGWESIRSWARGAKEVPRAV